jgi:hypothetical protein
MKQSEGGVNLTPLSHQTFLVSIAGVATFGSTCKGYFSQNMQSHMQHGKVDQKIALVSYNCSFVLVKHLKLVARRSLH